MKYIDIKVLNDRLSEIKKDYHKKKPFKYVILENFFPSEAAEKIYENYPVIENGKWDGTTYLDQKNKFQKNIFSEGSIMDEMFKELNSDKFVNWLQELTEVEDKIMGDEDLFGGGLHQSITGAFLNVHVDYNIHPITKFHRRINVLIYMNKEWKDEYEGHLELWDLTGKNAALLGRYAPTFNRCVIFETNEVSFHGHPKPLKTPEGINRKSIATYYYSKSRPQNEIVDEHNTIYVNTEGIIGSTRRISSGFKALLERINHK